MATRCSCRMGDSVVAAFLAVALSIVPVDTVVREQVDLIEINHFYDEQGRLTFDQAIFYEWSWSLRRYQVMAWRLVKPRIECAAGTTHAPPDILPVRDWSSGGYLSMWQDGERLRLIHAASIRETWTLYDVEVLEREMLPKDRRRELSSGRR